MKSVAILVLLCAFAHTMFAYRREFDPQEESQDLASSGENVADQKTELEPKEEILTEHSRVVSALLQYLEDFRNIILHGNNMIPILDPLDIPTVGPFNDVKFGFPIELILHNFHMEGLRQYNVEYVQMDTEKLVVSSKVTIPWLYFTGSYDCSANSPLRMLSREATGNFRVTVSGINIFVELYLGVTPTGVLNLQNLNIRIFLIEVQPVISEKQGSSILNAHIEGHVNTASDQLLVTEIEEIIPKLNYQLFPYINAFISQFTIDDVRALKA